MALSTIISCPKGLLTKRITKNKNTKIPSRMRKVLRNQRKLRFFCICDSVFSILFNSQRYTSKSKINVFNTIDINPFAVFFLICLKTKNLKSECINTLQIY